MPEGKTKIVRQIFRKAPGIFQISGFGQTENRIQTVQDKMRVDLKPEVYGLNLLFFQLLLVDLDFQMIQLIRHGVKPVNHLGRLLILSLLLNPEIPVVLLKPPHGLVDAPGGQKHLDIDHIEKDGNRQNIYQKQEA